MIASPSRRAPGLAATIGVVATLLVLLLAGHAKAGQDSWDCKLTSGAACSYDRHSLRVSAAFYETTTRVVGAAASTTGTTITLYGSWYWGVGWACRSYSGNNLLYPLAANGSNITLKITGYSAYGANEEPC